MSNLGDIKKITSTLYDQIVKEQDDATMQMIDNLLARNKELEIKQELLKILQDKIKEDYIPKSKVREIIQKYYDVYEKEKEYRYTLDVEDEQRVLRKIEQELLQERVIK